MSMYWRRAMIRMALPFTWRVSRPQAARGLAKFSAIEADSAWQFLHALDAVDDPAQRASLFNNALEEVHHAALFERAATFYTDAPPDKPRPERKALYDPAKGLTYFLAYVYVGEQDVYNQFGSYCAAIGPGPAQDAFRSAREDEDGHVEIAMAILRKEIGSESAIRRKVAGIRLRRGWEAWLRFSKALGEISSGVALGAVYFVFGPLAAWKCRRKAG